MNERQYRVLLFSWLRLLLLAPELAEEARHGAKEPSGWLAVYADPSDSPYVVRRHLYLSAAVIDFFGCL